MKKPRTPFIPGGGTLNAPPREPFDVWPWLGDASDPAVSAEAPAWAAPYLGEHAPERCTDGFSRYVFSIDALPVARILGRVRALRGDLSLYPIGHVAGELALVLLVDAEGRIFAFGYRGIVFVARNVKEAVHRLSLLCGDHALVAPRDVEVLVPFDRMRILPRVYDACEVLEEEHGSEGVRLRIMGMSSAVDEVLSLVRA